MATTEMKEVLCPFVCGLCSKGYDKIGLYYAHLKTHGEIEGLDELYDVHVAGENYTVDKNTSDIEHAEYICGVCYQSFSSMSLLHSHMVDKEKISSYSYCDEDHTARAYKKLSKDSPKTVENKKKTDINDEQVVSDESPVNAKKKRGRPKRLKEHVKNEHDGTDLNAFKNVNADKSYSCETSTEQNVVKRRGRPSKITSPNIDEQPIRNNHDGMKRKATEEVASEAFKQRKLNKDTETTDGKCNESFEESSVSKYGTRRSVGRATMKKVDYKALAGYGTPTHQDKEEVTKGYEKRAGKNNVRNETETKKIIRKESKMEVTKKKVDMNEPEKLNYLKTIQLEEVSHAEVVEAAFEDMPELLNEAYVEAKPLRQSEEEVEKEIMQTGRLPKETAREYYDRKHREGRSVVKKNMLYSCAICGRLLTYKALRRHKLTHMIDDNHKPFKCRHCNKSFRSKIHLEDHIRVAHRKYRFKCSKCDRSFKSRQMIEQHIAKHILLKEVEETSLNEISYEIIEVPRVNETSLNKEDETETVNENSQAINQNHREPYGSGTINIEAKNVVNPDGTTTFVYKSTDGLFEMVQDKSIIAKWKAGKLLSKSESNNRCVEKFETSNDSDGEGSTLKKARAEYLQPQKCDVCNKVFQDKYICNRHKRRFHLKKIYYCPLCKKELIRKDTYQSHMRNHVEKNQIKASEVDFNATVNRADVEIVNEKDEDYVRRTKPKPVDDSGSSSKLNTTCHICEKMYTSSNQYRQHMRRVHSRRIYYCDLCKKELRKKESMRSHMQTHINRGEILEEEVDFNRTIEIEESIYVNINNEDSNEFDEIAELEEAISGDEEDIDKISEQLKEPCKVVKIKPLEKSGDSNKTGGKQLEQNVSDTNKDESDKDSTMDFQIDVDEIMCDVCHAVFETSEHLALHKLRTHKKNVILTCSVCNATFKTQNSFNYHRSQHLLKSDKYYSEEVVKKLQQEMADDLKRMKPRGQRGIGSLSKRDSEMAACEICGAQIYVKRLKRHMETHRDTKEFQCDICFKYYKSRRYLTDHKVKSHKKKADQVCNICGKLYKGAKYLEIHMQTHGPRDKICTYCGKGFTTELYLKTHLQTHLEKKSFKCQICEAGFSQRVRLMIHMTEKHDYPGASKCKYCGVTFPSRPKARNHERVVHEGVKQKRKKNGRHGYGRRNIISPGEGYSVYLQGNKTVPVILMDETGKETTIPVMAVNTSRLTESVEQEEVQSGQEEYKFMIKSEGNDQVEFVELSEGEQNFIIQTSEGTASGTATEMVSSGNGSDYEAQVCDFDGHVLEIPEDAQQCQIILYPDGTFKLLNVLDAEK
ncbi:zinc finger protein 91-like [Dreissena polymorpha]|uniref:C2H2-type domain-containing protein n=1 Tax=Dreissena polymorpha TaxID=45954 RepID=A0A9D4CEK7_DREPO|nr:zinc finger protein 91-like [Dreissena polymorpha]KAH3722085.1 hypothetical protein DPMN_065036 [Dreissena polymorpha]